MLFGISLITDLEIIPLSKSNNFHVKFAVTEGQITDFFPYTSLEITKRSHTKITKITKKITEKNHVISKSQKSRTLFFEK